MKTLEVMEKEDIKLLKEFISKAELSKSYIMIQCLEKLYDVLDEYDKRFRQDSIITENLRLLKKGKFISNDTQDGVCYYLKGDKYYKYHYYFKNTETTTFECIRKHIESDAYEIDRYFHEVTNPIKK